MKLGIFAALLLAGLTANADDVPKIKFDRLIYDFGTTSLVESVTGTFTIENVGGGVLEIGKVKPSCGCTGVKLSADKLKHGEKSELAFTIALGTSAQELDKAIFVPSNDPENSGTDLAIKVITKAVLRSQPPSVSPGEVRLGTSTNITVTVQRFDGKRLSITKVESTSRLVSATIEPTATPEAQSQRLHIEFKGEGIPGYLSSQLRVFTDDSLGAALAISAYAQVVGDLRVDPQAVAWGMPDPEHWDGDNDDVILSRSLFVTATDPEKPLTIGKLVSSLKELTLTVETIEENRKYMIEATLAHRLTNAVHGTISFETNLADLPKVEVPVDITVWRTD